MWYYNDQLITTLPTDSIGFVYCITNLTNNKKYIGKKLSHFTKTTTKTITLKNGTKKKKKVKTLVESDWQTYYGSSDHLNKDVEELGAHNFHREILYFAPNKGTLSYMELRYQIDLRVMESDNFYNAFVGGKIHKNHIKL